MHFWRLCQSEKCHKRGCNAPQTLLFYIRTQSIPPMTQLTSYQISDLVQAHCYRVIDNMDADDLMSFAIQMMVQSFDQNPGQGDTDVPMLIEDIWVAEGEDDDSTLEFIAGVVGNDLADEIMKTTQF